MVASGGGGGGRLEVGWRGRCVGGGRRGGGEGVSDLGGGQAVEVVVARKGNWKVAVGG